MCAYVGMIVSSLLSVGERPYFSSVVVRKMATSGARVEQREGRPEEEKW